MPRAYFRNLQASSVLSPTFALDQRTRLVPPCECWTKRPRWTVRRVLWLWWRCVDCGRFARKERV